MLIISACSSGFSFRDSTSYIQVKTPNGDVLGIEEENLYVFKGLAYAKAPVGELRWKAPRDVAISNEIIDATEFKSECIQPASESFISNWNVSVGNEDCLFLNIYVPKNQTEINKNKFPVMFWIHGGSNIWGSGDLFLLISVWFLGT